MGKKTTPTKNGNVNNLELSPGDTVLLEKLNSRLKLSIDTSSTKSLISGLLEALVKIVGDDDKGWQNVESAQQKKNRKQERFNSDRIDALAQRNLKGNFIIHSPENQEKGLHSLLKNESDLGDQSYVDHVRGLVSMHYSVDIPKEDIAACHPLGKGAAILKIWNRKNCAPYHKLVSAVKAGGKFGIEQKKRRSEKKQGERGERGDNLVRPNLFITFQLTKRRSEIVKHLKNLKKAKKIVSFTTCQNGLIAYKQSFDSERVFVTIKCDESDESKKTFTISEIDDILK